jgi:hypothetical protein
LIDQREDGDQQEPDADDGVALDETLRSAGRNAGQPALLLQAADLALEIGDAGFVFGDRAKLARTAHAVSAVSFVARPV